jgi:hypothetical protein
MTTEAVKQKKLKREKPVNLFQQILNVNAAPVTLNYLFNNIRIYTFSTTIVVAGIWLLSNGDPILGIHVVICCFVLTTLNFIHSILTIAKKPGEALTWFHHFPYVTCGFGRDSVD